MSESVACLQLLRDIRDELRALNRALASPPHDAARATLGAVVVQSGDRVLLTSATCLTEQEAREIGDQLENFAPDATFALVNGVAP